MPGLHGLRCTHTSTYTCPAGLILPEPGTVSLCARPFLFPFQEDSTWVVRALTWFVPGFNTEICSHFPLPSLCTSQKAAVYIPLVSTLRCPLCYKCSLPPPAGYSLPAAPEIPRLSTPGETNFSYKETVSILGFAGHMISAATTLCLCSEKVKS